ncbi:hypothetical protein EW146_g2811 [Bondarzewia mesenterica]|uniref:DNA-directed RNA polymerases I, II, and III subunit RPABC1 n=1 Tax=Bondarzewia mesenterica TaxID=1095465 RepID=A0A4S4M017_9AGAM|nr:hypothetical protein EW146_g2811 [Bondarzewia mesenterica]
MSEGDDVAKLWKVNRTIHELVRDRGFQVSDDEVNMDLATFKSMYASSGESVEYAQLSSSTLSRRYRTQYLPMRFLETQSRNQLNFFTNSSTNAADQIFVFFSDEKSVGVKTMRKLLSILDEKQINRGVIIFPGTMTSSARKADHTQVILAMQNKFKLEEFAEADLLVNITHHKLVPRHEVLSLEEKKTFVRAISTKGDSAAAHTVSRPNCPILWA